jgi:hypothetical protein
VKIVKKKNVKTKKDVKVRVWRVKSAKIRQKIAILGINSYQN